MFENFEKTIIDLQFLGPAAIWAVWFSDMVTQQFELKLVEGRQSLLVYDDWEHSFKEETGEIIIWSVIALLVYVPFCWANGISIAPLCPVPLYAAVIATSNTDICIKRFGPDKEKKFEPVECAAMACTIFSTCFLILYCDDCRIERKRKKRR